MSDWQPTEQGLSDLLQLFREAINPTDAQNVQDRLEYFNKVPDYNSYLAYILTQMPQEDQYIRSVAGLTLKNNIRSYFAAIPGPVMDYVKSCCLQHVGDPDIGSTVSIVIVAIVTHGQVHNWPQALQVLLEKLDSPNPAVVEGALSTLQKICEDCARDLDGRLGGVQPLEFMIPKLISFFNHPKSNLRCYAIQAASNFISLRSAPLMARMTEFLAGLFSRATDDDVKVRKAVCQALVSLLEVCPTVLLPHLPDLVNYMLFSTQSEDADLALEACEFWLVFAEQEELRNHLQPYLPMVVPVLLKGMVYSELDLMTLGGDQDDAHIADSEQDIKPRFHKANVAGADHTDRDESSDKKKGRGEGLLADEDEDEDDEDDDDDDDDFSDDEDIYGEWNLRKCSAAALDVLCNSFEGECIRLLMPLLKTELESGDWLHRECGILALGAAAEGGIIDIAPHLPELVPYLLTNLNDSKPLVRSITCWALGRYANWIVQSAKQNADVHKHLFEPLVQLLLQRILDDNKRVQEAACSAFSLLEEEATTDLVPYLHPILVTLSTAFMKYQHRNSLTLFDTLGTLAEVVGDALNNPQYIELIMPPIIKKWSETPDDSPDLFPLLECLSAITTGLGKAFKPFAEPVYRRCVHLVCKTLEACRLAAQNPGMEEPDEDFMIVALDLLSGIVQALNSEAEPLVASTNPPVISFLSLCVQDEVAEVRQSAYALFGDLAISCFEHIRTAIPQFMPNLLLQIDHQADHPSVCNNATWAAGEIAIKWGAEFRVYVEPLLLRLFPLMVNPQVQRTLLENVAITIGRLGLVFPDMVAPQLENFIQPWLNTLSPIRDNDEKASAFSGLCEMIKANPQGAVKCIPDLCNAIASYRTVPAGLNEQFGNILAGYKNMYGSQVWQQVITTVGPEVAATLHERYGA
ncbi:armadillo-type protein [Phycomyces nitens]|nr:armadillo-type protein [Phycomyces nitens]